MPPDMPLPETDIQLVASWIRNGADERLMRLRRFQRATAAQRLSGAAAFALLALLLFASRDAAAYPQFQFSSGTTRCGQCHFAPAGTGLINDWGRGEAGDTISRGGDGAFLHGLWTPPSWVALGGDFRLASLANATGGPESPELVTFPMQADAYAHFVLPAGVLAEPDCRRSRHHAADRRLGRRAHHVGGRSLHLARALPDVAAERDRPLRAHRPLLPDLRPAPGRAHLLRAALHRQRALRRALRAVGRLHRRRLGGARQRLHRGAVVVSRLLPVDRLR